MPHGYRLSKKVSPTLKECNLEGCHNQFWGDARDKYCSPECKYEAKLLSNRIRHKRWIANHPGRAKQYAKNYYYKHRGDKE